MILMLQTVGAHTRRCDYRCYEAKPNTRCSCICGGRNHAVGLKRALENVRTILASEDGPKVTRKAQRAIRRMEEQPSLVG